MIQCTHLTDSSTVRLRKIHNRDRRAFRERNKAIFPCSKGTASGITDCTFTLCKAFSFTVTHPELTQLDADRIQKILHLTVRSAAVNHMLVYIV